MTERATRAVPVLMVAAVLTVVAMNWMSSSAVQGQAQRTSRTINGKPDFSGVWQALNEANWDLQAHPARAGAITQPGYYPYDYARVPAAPVLALGAAGGVPASLGVVQGDGQIPYTAEALAKRQENAEHWIDRDPELKCYVPGAVRALYLPYPFQIVQGTKKVQLAFAFANAARTIHLDEVDEPPADTSMGFSKGHWDGNTLVVETSRFLGTWLDRAGNFYSDSLRLTERFSPISPDAIQYEATFEDPSTFAKPWTIAMPLYRRLEPNVQLLDYPCVEFVEEFMYGHARKKPLVTHWEGDTIVIDVTRKTPPRE